jgi:cellobiose phosphorylase
MSDPTTGRQTARFCTDLIKDREQLAPDNAGDLLRSLSDLAAGGNRQAVLLMHRITKLSDDIRRIISTADFKPLFDYRKRLFRIGYHVYLQKPDRGHYDLMASESRLTSFLAIAKGDIPKRHWMALGRPLTLVRGMPAIVSWSGSMFEYLMPNLVMRVPPGSVMEYSCRAAVVSQIRYGRKHKIPWGISESQYFIFDNQANYQYGPFGVSRMRLQPSLKPVKVVAPYATLLALGTYPRKALINVQRLYRAGAGAQYGLYEALDYSSPDSNALSDHSTIKSFMTHHLGMSLAAINNLLNDNILQTRFHRDPMIRANEILLEERFTSPMVTIASIGYTIDVESEQPAREELQSRIVNTVHPPFPMAHVLCNGHFQTMMTSEGNGFCAFDHVRINRWRSDWRYGGGTFVYIREPGTGRLWSSTFAPVNIQPDTYQAVFSHDKVEIKRRDGAISTLTEVTVSPVDPIEIRRVTLTNHGTRTAHLELTSYLEVVADDPMADMSHPAYSKLFVETQFMVERSLIIARRRPKSDDERIGYVMHMVRTEADLSSPVRYETSRQDFIGRGGSTASPEALMPGNNLIGKGGSPTDPIMSLQVGLSIATGRSVSISFVTGYCPSMNALLNLCDKLAVRLSDEDIFKLARTSSLLEIEYFKIRSVQLNAIQNLVGAIYCPTNAFREGTDDLMQNTLGQSGLWRFGISGDRPIMLLRISEQKDKGTLKDVLLAYEFLRLQKVRTDLVILNEAEGGYDDSIQQMIFEETTQVRVFEHSLNRLGIYVIRAGQTSREEKTLLLSSARIIFTPQTGIYFRKAPLSEKVPPSGDIIRLTAGNHPAKSGNSSNGHLGEPVPEFFNGIGGFVRDGREYEIRLNGKTKTPAPWINVVTNGRFGFQISEIGSGYTWQGNSRENKLTVWSNDPIMDPPSEVVYVRNNRTGVIVSPCALIPGAEGFFRVRHGFGYSVFVRKDVDMDLSLTVFTAAEDPVKLMMLTIENKTNEIADISAALYVEWVLGAFRELTERFIITEYRSESEIFTAHNTYATEKGRGLTYLFSERPVTTYTGDRETFIGKDGSISYPSGLLPSGFPTKTGAGLDPCGVIACNAMVAPMAKETLLFGLGYASDVDEADKTANRFRKPGQAPAELKKSRQFWDRLPGNITIRTPNRAMDILMNGWLMYQVVACRLMARAAFYQCGGAYGFRDQLQDVLAVMDYNPELTRNHILLCCSRQFIEGDVQHWWHQPDGPGVRTRISDDLLFLPYAVAEYIRYTGDSALLREQATYLEAEVLAPGRHEKVSDTVVSKKSGDVYEHCVLAIERACTFGQHGLPLIGGGDWNDGMNAVGVEGKGESVWLGWFLYRVMDLFVPICIGQGDGERTDRFRRLMSSLKESLDKHAWDGQWYLRAFFDNGRPMGSARNDECRIDSISQSWAVISGAADRQRASTALRSAHRLLISQEEGIIRLLTPPFDRGENHPGYISGYNPGFRENGGQYTHAAVWMAMAFSELGDIDEAYRLINMLNPIHATADFRLLSRYQNEPYVMTADVSDGYPNVGKGGWSWYTGAAGWMYRAILTHLLGLNREGQYLVFTPKSASPFDRYQIEYRYRSTLYEISFEKRSNIEEAVVIFFDGKKQRSQRIKLEDESTVHHIEVNF